MARLVIYLPRSPTKGAAAGLVRIIGSLLLLVARMVGRSVPLCLPENSEGFAAVARWEFYTSRGSLDSFLSSSEGRLFSLRNRELILSIEGIFVTCLILPKYGQYGLNLSTRPRDGDRVSNLRVALAPPPIYRKLLSKETLANG